MPARWTAEQYPRLVDQGVLGPDDRVELLEGVIVAKAPQNEPHAAGVRRAEHALHRAVGDRAVVQAQLSLISGRRSVPEPDAAVLPGTIADYDRTHPRTALLVVEVADTSLKQDRITKRPPTPPPGPHQLLFRIRRQRIFAMLSSSRAARLGSLAIMWRIQRNASPRTIRWDGGW